LEVIGEIGFRGERMENRKSKIEIREREDWGPGVNTSGE
jgi:hypothetical protein